MTKFKVSFGTEVIHVTAGHPGVAAWRALERLGIAEARDTLLVGIEDETTRYTYEVRGSMALPVASNPIEESGHED